MKNHTLALSLLGLVALAFGCKQNPSDSGSDTKGLQDAGRGGVRIIYAEKPDPLKSIASNSYCWFSIESQTTIQPGQVGKSLSPYSMTQKEIENELGNRKWLNGAAMIGGAGATVGGTLAWLAAPFTGGGTGVVGAVAFVGGLGGMAWGAEDIQTNGIAQNTLAQTAGIGENDSHSRLPSESYDRMKEAIAKVGQKKSSKLQPNCN